MHKQPCCECDGQGLTRSEDWDEHGSHIVNVTCEACDGHGELTDCVGCDEPISLAAYEEGSGHCGPCRADRERGDQAAEIARIRRAS